MAKFKIHKSKDYTIMSNVHLKEKEMSLKAKGLLSLMFSLPEDWNYSIDGLVAICKENETAIKSTLDEIKSFGYLTITKLYPNETQSKRIEYIYDIYESPKQEGKKQGLENLPLEVLPLENRTQLNTKILNTKLTNNEIINAFAFSENAVSSINQWLSYKKEKGQTYKETGLKTLLKRLKQLYDEKGEQALIGAIEHSMANNYSGIFEPSTKKTEKPKTRQGNFDIDEAFATALERTYGK
jgi:hypothetical protein